MKKSKKTDAWMRVFIMFGAVVCLWGWNGMTAEAKVQDSPYVTFSPDGNAFTTNADETDTEWYSHGSIAETGRESALGEPAVGEHLYDVIRTDEVPVSRWVVDLKAGSCIHDRYTDDKLYHGVSFGRSKCLKPYYSGWIAYCADCDQRVVGNLFYMSKEAAASIDELDMTLAYYYRCPWCTNLEQGVELEYHMCRDISANQYSVRYHANFGKGDMPKSVHMYNNAEVYEGTAVTPQKKLTLNSYTREGYEFIGWNTEMDGSGISFEDGAEILNLSSEEQGNIILYAQWKKSRSVLAIDPNGGKYLGAEGISKVSGEYGSIYTLDIGSIKSPDGPTVYFDTNGGQKIPDITVKTEFLEWSFQNPIHGTVEGNTYTYTGANGVTDHAVIRYKRLPVLLPEVQREGYSFGGWCYDKEGAQAAGMAGDAFLPAEDVTLYASWVDLQLNSEDNYSANGGKGAVDLMWQQSDGREKYYLLYQKKEDGPWQQIYEATEISIEKQIQKEFTYSGKEESYTIPYSGFYRVCLYGAQGEDYELYKGGKGGGTEAVIYFEKGENLTFVLGGRDGYNGGGTGSLYGNGGGFSSLSSDLKDLILVAGGGGGASVCHDGQEGGSDSGNVVGSQGEAGAAGGGGGFQGGSCGDVVTHQHVSDCEHVHIGSESVYGGCYTVSVSCGGISYRAEKYAESFYYGNIDDYGNHILCPRCASYECSGHLDEYYRYYCLSCGTCYYDRAPASCDSGQKYAAGCGMEEDYICGYGEGQVISSNAAYGGSNFINKPVCQTYEEKIGVQEGNGALLIEAVHIGFTTNNHLSGVNAADRVPPDSIAAGSIKISAVAENKINVSFQRPEDKGTVYYHMAESYDITTGLLLSTSNQTVNTLTSEIKGYRYLLDENPETVVSEQNELYVHQGENPYISIAVSEKEQYLHIAAEDRAGNLSKTVHVPVSTRELIFWPVKTRQIEIRESESVCKATNLTVSGETIDYYVKADGTTPFYASFQGVLLGTALEDYQVNRLHFAAADISETVTEGVYKIRVPMRTFIDSSSYTYPAEALQRQYKNSFCLTDASYTVVKRSDFCREASVLQAFSILESLDGHIICLTPKAGIVSGKTEIWSDRDEDQDNSVRLLADGKGPDIEGVEGFENRKDSESEYTVVLTAQDEGCGLQKFWIEIINSDNGGFEKINDSDNDGVIEITVSPEAALFSGKLIVEAHAVDKVGNETVMTYGMDGIFLTAYIQKEKEPQSTVFQRGESGILSIRAAGYVDKVEVSFPEEWCARNPSLNKNYTYEEPGYLQTEELRFMVPFGVKDGEYKITVKAFKGDKMVEARPRLLTITISGSILDEIRTRLR